MICASEGWLRPGVKQLVGGRVGWLTAVGGEGVERGWGGK